jgi:hypothetical protein
MPGILRLSTDLVWNATIDNSPAATRDDQEQHFIENQLMLSSYKFKRAITK